MLEMEGIPFTTHRLGKSKLEMQGIMEKNTVMKPFAIPSLPFTHQNLNTMLGQYNEIFLKPNSGHRAKGILVLKEEPNTGRIQVTDTESLVKTIDKKEIPQQFYEESYKMYHLQPAIASVTKEGFPYVIRSYIRRDGQGEWANVFQRASINAANKIVNISAGSYISYITPFLKDQFGEDGDAMRKKLRRLSKVIADEVQKYVNPMIDALGIDWGITRNGDFYIFEVNCYPGTKVFEAAVERLAIPYCLYLAKQSYEK